MHSQNRMDGETDSWQLGFNCNESIKRPSCSNSNDISNHLFQDGELNVNADQSKEDGFLSISSKDMSSNNNYPQVYMDTDEKPILIQPDTLVQAKRRDYTCDVCAAVFCDSSSIKEHMLTHKRSRPLHCGRCDQYFVLAASLRAHKQQHMIEDTLPCPDCSKRFKTLNALTMHMKVHENDESYECGICCKVFPKSYSLLKHMETHTAPPSYECEICHKHEKSQKVLNIHKRRVHRIYNEHVYRYKCSVCDIRHKTQSALTQHRITHHSKKKYDKQIYRIKCWFCQSRFKKRSQLNNHIKRIHRSSQKMLPTSDREVINSGTLNNMHLSSPETQIGPETSIDDTTHQYSVKAQDIATDATEVKVEVQKHTGAAVSICKEFGREDTQPLNKIPMLLNYGMPFFNNDKDSSDCNGQEDTREYTDERDEEVDDDGDGSVDEPESDRTESSVHDTGLMGASDVVDNTSDSDSSEDTGGDSDDKLRDFLDRFVSNIMGYNGKTKKELQTYKCDLCSHEFQGFDAVKTHMLQHSKLLPHYCVRCDIFFVLARNMKAHLSLHESEDPLVCKLCNEVFYTSEGLDNHSLTHEENLPYKCGVCGRGFQDQDIFSLHMRFHNNSLFNCSICHESMASKQEIIVHKRKVHFIYGEKYRFGCDLCEMKFQSKRAVTRHKAEFHNFYYKCNHCDAKYKSKQVYKRHKINAHRDFKA